MSCPLHCKVRAYGSCPSRTSGREAERQVKVTGAADFHRSISNTSYTRGGTRARNLLLRREAPCPLGHTSYACAYMSHRSWVDWSSHNFKALVALSQQPVQKNVCRFLLGLFDSGSNVSLQLLFFRRPLLRKHGKVSLRWQIAAHAACQPFLC
jgi:hypothetical protein